MIKMDVVPVRPSVFAALFFLATCILVLSYGVGYLLRILYFQRGRDYNGGV